VPAIATTVTAYDDDTTELSYTCACGHCATVKLAQYTQGKLVWKVDWPMRWTYEGVTFEPSGVDHSSPGSSYVVGGRIVTQIFGGVTPIGPMYAFVGMPGHDEDEQLKGRRPDSGAGAAHHGGATAALALHAQAAVTDSDPIVLAHARALLTSAPGGACAYIDADLRDTDNVLRQAAETLDFSKPVAVMVLCTMQYIPDTDDPHAIIARLMNAVPAGSFLAMSDTTRDIDTPAMTTGAHDTTPSSGPPSSRRARAPNTLASSTACPLSDPAWC
jgi:hypothetical protein